MVSVVHIQQLRARLLFQNLQKDLQNNADFLMTINCISLTCKITHAPKRKKEAKSPDLLQPYKFNLKPSTSM